VADEDVYVCPAGEKLAYSFTTQDKGMVLRRYRTTACHSCVIKNSCYNLTRVMNIMGIQPLMAVMRA
jgi:hypothetical protein